MVNIFYSSEFRKEVKRLAKKYRSIPEDLIELRNRLIENPVEGADLGFGVRKVRMSIKSKGKGKSGGARVITYNVTEVEDAINITMQMLSTNTFTGMFLAIPTALFVMKRKKTEQ